MRKWRTTLLALVALPLLMQAGVAPAVERVARCVITSRGEPAWRGRCTFTSGRGGSFTLSGVDGSSLDGMSDFALNITAPGVGRASYMMASADTRMAASCAGRGATVPVGSAAIIRFAFTEGSPDRRRRRE